MKDGREAALQARISANSWDTAAWDGLVAIASASGDLEQQREVLEQVVERFPTAAKYWQQYAELELDESDASKAKLVFSRCLLDCPSVKLWSLYLRFIKKMNEAKGTQGLPELRKSYEYTLERVGTDSSAGTLWMEYINFLQAPRIGTPAFQALFSGGLPGQEETQRILLLRRAYHKALTVPGKHLDQVWRMYDEFERRSSNAQLARREIDEQRPRYQAAKQAATERARLQQNLHIYNLAVPPGSGGWEQQEQAKLWKEFIAWEKSNPQRMDNAALSQRVNLVYEQALMPLMHLPEVWYGLSQWHCSEAGNGAAAAASVLKKACRGLPECSLLHYAAAELQESRGETEAARSLYEERVEELFTLSCQSPQHEVSSFMTNCSSCPALPMPPEPSTSGTEDAAQSSLAKEVREAGTLLWIHYMRFTRRVDGVAASRKIFLRARRWHGCSWQAFVAAALMEYAGDGNDRVARNIFELGLEQFMASPGYVLQYANFLIGLADLHNARALFERALGETSADESKLLWDRYIQMQSMYGDLAAVTQLVQRRREALGVDLSDETDVLLVQHRVLDIWPCTDDQKAHLQRLTGELPPISPPKDAVAHPHPGLSPQADVKQPQQNSGATPQGQQNQAPVSSGPPAKPEPIKQMPPELGMFLAALPPPRGEEPPYASVDLVIEILMKADLSPAALTASESSATRHTPKTLPAPILAPANASVKRDREDPPEAGEILENAPAVDMYRARVKQRFRRGA